MTDPSTQPLIVTENALKRIKHLLTKEEKGSFLRVNILGGGCSGFQYTFLIDNTIKEDDTVIDKNSIKVVTDSLSLSLIKGSTLDFIEELIGSSFLIKDNPNASANCGCGSSFSVI